MPPINKASNFDAALGARIKAARKAERISAAQLAEACFVTYQQIQKIESGANRCPPERLVIIAAVLKTTPHQLLGTNGAKPAAGLVERIASIRGTYVVHLLDNIAKLAEARRHDALRALEDVSSLLVR